MAEQTTPFGKYRLIRRIATGGMAELFLAKQTGLSGFEKLVVIKRILPYLCDNEDFVRMLLDEARIAAQLSHPNIVQIYDLGREGDSYFIAMEYVAGEDMERILHTIAHQGKTIPLKYAVRIGAWVCEALYYAHRQVDLKGRPLNIVHRDVTPGNVMVSYQGNVKLVDFGIAKATAQLERTRPGIVKGKFLYMSPEQVHQMDVDHRADIFSTGTLLYEVCTGVRPFERPSVMEVLTAVRDEDPTPPAELVPGFPKRLSDVLMFAMRKDREKRYRNCRELQVDLEAVLAQLGGSPGTVELSSFMRELFGDPARQGSSGPPAETSPMAAGPWATEEIPPGVFEDPTDAGLVLGAKPPPHASPPPLPQRATLEDLAADAGPAVEPSTVRDRRPPAKLLMEPAPAGAVNLAKAGPADDTTSPSQPLREVPSAVSSDLTPVITPLPAEEPPKVPTGLRNLFDFDDGTAGLFDDVGGASQPRPAGDDEPVSATNLAAMPAGSVAPTAPRPPLELPEHTDSTRGMVMPSPHWRRAVFAGLAGMGLGAAVFATFVLYARSGRISPQPPPVAAERPPPPEPDQPAPPPQEQLEPATIPLPPERTRPAPDANRWTVEVRSIPLGALVSSRDGKVQGQTPFFWTPPRDKPTATLRFTLKGYEATSREVNAERESLVLVSMKPASKRRR